MNRMEFFIDAGLLKVAAREAVQREMFTDPELEYKQAIQLFQHAVDWSNRMNLREKLSPRIRCQPGHSRQLRFRTTRDVRIDSFFKRCTNFSLAKSRRLSR